MIEAVGGPYNLIGKRRLPEERHVITPYSIGIKNTDDEKQNGHDALIVDDDIDKHQYAEEQRNEKLVSDVYPVAIVEGDVPEQIYNQQN